MAKKSKKIEDRTSLAVSLDTKEGIGEVADRFNLSQKFVLDMVIGWFRKQPEEIQAPILMQIPQAYQSKFARLILEEFTLTGEDRENQIEAEKFVEEVMNKQKNKKK